MNEEFELLTEEERNRATKKQREFARKIALTLNISYNANMTKQEAYFFIRDNIEKYNMIKQLKYIVGSDNPYAGPYGTDIVDCYDFGITPYGNS